MPDTSIRNTKAEGIDLATLQSSLVSVRVKSYSGGLLGEGELTTLITGNTWGCHSLLYVAPNVGQC